MLVAGMDKFYHGSDEMGTENQPAIAYSLR
jgi:hypothetical protein